MKVFAGMVLGVAMTISMMYECFGVFILALAASFFLWASTQPRLMDDDDYSKKKSASARQH
ncbi:hypothetical protein [Limosilactobacillus oris]|uniref:hypothetical protein n=1 Tax=Limosilactobacillus oris TaxID=1632 RepID=UPI0024B3272B|nr:hypothetical protein [Limosilactobacillus oris]WHO86425.1 hypothetical protein QLX69_04290 [Limosilactobacillus oris]